ncbi:MAG TPA: 50S ribosomal protein L29 [archaeon]|nr:50S ribosomal protein L29 [archaeon]
MPIVRMHELKQMTPEDLDKKLTEFRTELVKLRAMSKAGGAVENPSRIKEIRRTIARILTIQKQNVTASKKEKRNNKGKTEK